MVDAVGTAHIAEWMGWVSIALCIGSMAGPLLGGVIFAVAGYDAVFWMLIGLILLDIVFRVIMVERQFPDLEVDQPAAKPSQVTDPQHLGSSVQNPDLSSKEDDMVVEVTTPEPGQLDHINADIPRRQLPAVLSLLASQRMLIAVWNTAVLAAIFSGFQAVLAVYVMKLWGWDALGAGLIFLPLTIPSFIAPVVGRFSDRFGARWITFAGFICMCPPLVLLMLVGANTVAHKVVLCVLLGLIGLAITLVLDPLLGEYVAVAKSKEISRPGSYNQPRDAYAQAYALFNGSWAVGNVGSLWAGLMYERYGWAVMAWSLGLLSGLTSLLALLPRSARERAVK
jgi:MFS family permease